MAAWPGSLTMQVIEDPARGQKDENRVRTSMDAGPRKQRRRHSAVPRKVIGTVLLSGQTEINTFNTFHDTTLAEGTEAFDFTDPENGGTTEMRLYQKIEKRFFSGSQQRVTLYLEILP